MILDADLKTTLYIYHTCFASRSVGIDDDSLVFALFLVEADNVMALLLVVVRKAKEASSKTETPFVVIDDCCRVLVVVVVTKKAFPSWKQKLNTRLDNNKK